MANDRVIWKIVFACFTVSSICYVLYSKSSTSTNQKGFPAWPHKKSSPSGLTSYRDVFEGALKATDFVVPNIAHYIWFSCHEFGFINLLSILSVYKIMKSERIIFHTDCEPNGKWWAEAKNKVPILEVWYITAPDNVFGQDLNLNWPEHQADVAKLQILAKFGGVYLDPDVIVVTPLESLRKYEYVISLNGDNSVDSGLIIANNNSEFLRLFYASYKDYKNKCWICNSVENQEKLARDNKHIVHIQKSMTVRPNFDKWKTLFFGKFPWRKGQYAFHIWTPVYKHLRDIDTGTWPEDFTPEYIKNLDSTFAEICRILYFDIGCLTTEMSKGQ
ncbi:uncharacterized protein [Ptychodera flava]